MANGLPPVDKLTKSATLPPIDDLKKKDVTELPSTLVPEATSLDGRPEFGLEPQLQQAPSKIQPTEDFDIDWIKSNQDAYKQYFNEAWDSGLFTEKEISEAFGDGDLGMIQQRLAESKTPSIESRFGDEVPEELEGQLYTQLQPQYQQELEINLGQEKSVISNTLRENVLTQIPESVKADPEKLAEVEQMMKEANMTVDLTGEGKIGDIGKIESGLRALGKGTEDLFWTMTWGIAQPWTKLLVEEKRKESQQEWNKKINQYEQSFSQSLKEGDFDNAFGQVLNTLGESTPDMALAAATGGAGRFVPLATMSFTSGTQEFLNVKDESWFQDMSSAEKVGYISVKGVSEGVGEWLGGRVFSRAGRGLLRAATKESSEKGIKEFMRGAVKAYGLNVRDEGLGEMITEAGSILADSAIKGEKITVDQITDRLINSGLMGGAVGGMITTAGKVGEASMFLAHKSDFVKELTEKLTKLREEAQQADTPEQKESIQELYTETYLQKSEEIRRLHDLYSNKMSKEDLIKSVNINKEITDLETKAKQLESSPEAHSAIQEKISNLHNQKQKIENNYAVQQQQEKVPVEGEIKEGDVEKQAEEKDVDDVEKQKEQEQILEEKVPETKIEEVSKKAEEKIGAEITPSKEKIVKPAPAKEVSKEPLEKPEVPKPPKPQKASIDEIVKLSSKETAKKEISEHLKGLTKKGVLTNTKSKALANAATKINPDSQQSINKFKNYASQVFEHAEYLDNVRDSRRFQSNAKKNLKKRGKLGIDEMGVIGKTLEIDPTTLTNEELKDYNNYLEKAGAKEKSIEVSKVITEANDILRKYEDRIDKEVKEATEKAEKEVDEVAEAELTDFVIKKKKDVGKSETELDDSNFEFIDSITKEDVDGLSSSEKGSLAVEMGNVSDGNLTKGFYDLKRKITARRKSDSLKELVGDGDFRTLLRDKLMNPIANIFGKGKGSRELLFRYIKNNPLSDIDRSVKRMDSAIHNLIIEPLAIAHTRHTNFKENAEETLLDQMKTPSLPGKMATWRKKNIHMALLAIQAEYLSNPESKETNPVDDYVKATLDYSETAKATTADKQHAKELGEVYNKYKGSDGKFDIDKARKGLSKEQERFMEAANEFLNQAGDMESRNAARRGDLFRKRDDYTPIIVKYNDTGSLQDILDKSNKFFQPSTKSGRTKARTAGAKPLNFIYQNAVLDAIKGASIDFHFGEELSSVNGAIETLSKDKDISETNKAFVGALSDALKNVTEGMFLNNMFKDKKIQKLLMKRGYQLALAGTGRAVDELVSNAAHAVIYRPKDFGTGMSLRMKSLKGDEGISDRQLYELLSKVGSTQLTRMFSNASVGKMMEGGWIESISNTGYGRKVDKIADFLISTPDKMVSKTLWVGTFYRNFKKATGNEFDVQKATTDKSYLDSNKEAIRDAKRTADGVVIESVASTNPFEGVIESQIRPDDSFIKQFDKYMTRFARFEFASLMKGVESAVGRGRLTRREGAALATATVARMTIYSAILGSLGGLLPYAIYSLTGGEDDEKFKKSWEETNPMTDKGKANWLRSFVGSVITLLLLRRLGNVHKSAINYGIEKINKDHLEFLRDGEDYNPYENSLVFASASPSSQKDDFKPKRPLQHVAAFSGAYSNFVKTFDRGMVLSNRALHNKTEKSRNKAKEELWMRILPELVMETIGMPMSKDIRKAILMHVAEEYKTSKKSSGVKGKKERKKKK